MSNKIVSAVIVSCAKYEYLVGCLDSLLGQDGCRLEIIVLLNSSSPEIENKLKKNYPQAAVYPHEKNLFYCQPLNEGIHKSRGDYLLCLNDDVILEKDFIQEALKPFSRFPRVGMVSGKILRSDKITVDSTGLFLSYWLTARERGYGARDRGQFEKEEYIFGVNGAVAFYSRRMLDDIRENNAFFDPRFNIFYEDLDIAWRAQRKGWKGYYAPKALAYHLRGGTVRAPQGINKPLPGNILTINYTFIC